MRKGKLYASISRFVRVEGGLLDVLGFPAGPVEPLAEAFSLGHYGTDFCLVSPPADEVPFVDVVPVSSFVRQCMFIPCQDDRVYAIGLPRRYRHD